MLREINNEKFKYILDFLLNPFVTTGISEKKISKEIDKQQSYEKYPLPTDIFEYVKENNTGRNIDVLTVQHFISQQPEELHDFYKSIITKTLKLGIDAKTVNKVYGKGFIPTFDVMLGTSIENCKIPDGTWFSISHKLNGNRCVYYKGKLYTRQGKEYTGLEHIIKDIESIYNKDVILDGELIYKNHEELSDSEAFQKGTGIAQTKSDKNKTSLKLVVFDIMHKDEFERGDSDDTYKERCFLIEGLRSRIERDRLENLAVVDIFYQGTDQSKIWKWLDYAEDNDLEGLMLNLDTPYECKRTKNLIKVKRFHTADLRVIGCEEGTGRNKGRMGALIADFKGNPVNVGSGFSDELRVELWKNRDSIIDSIIEVKYKEITRDKKTNKESLQFPVFICMRPDKDEVSYE